MKKFVLSVVLSLFCILSIAQTSNQLIAVHQFNNLADINAIANPVRGNLAFNLDNGFLYYYVGVNWVQTPSSSVSGWQLDGNNVSSSDFLGTTNNESLNIGVNNSLLWKVMPNGSFHPLGATQYKIGIGENTLPYSNGYNNIAIGFYALSSNTNGHHNIAIGKNSQTFMVASNNTAVGANSMGGSNPIVTGGSNSSHNNNTALGYRAYPYSLYSNSTALGANTGISASNQVRIDNGVNSIGGPTAWGNFSDKRFKENIKDNVPGLNFIMGLKPLTYNINFKALNFHQSLGWEDTITSDEHYRKLFEEVQIGFLAQDVEALADSLNFDFHRIDKPQKEQSSYALRYAEFVVPLVKAMQEQQGIIEQQNKQIYLLKKEVDLLKKESKQAQK